MKEKLSGLNRFRKRRAPEIETALGTWGMVGMAGVVSDPERAKDASSWSPVGISAITDIASKIGISEHATFTALTLLFGLAAIDGIYKIRRRQRRNP